MRRDEYKNAISDAVNDKMPKKKKSQYVYAKNDTENYNIMNRYGSQENAVKWAKARYEERTDEKYANHNPCTTVHKLVLQLLNRDEDLIKAVMAKMYPEKE